MMTTMAFFTKKFGFVDAFIINSNDTKDYDEKVEENDGTWYISQSRSGCMIAWKPQ